MPFESPSLDQSLTPGQQRAWLAFLTMHRRLFVHLHRHVQAEFGLSGAEYEVLSNLWGAPEMRMRPFELSKATQWEKSRMSHLLTRMAQRGLVRRETTRDPRYADIVITDAGRDIIERATPRHAEAVRALFVDAIGDDRLATFTQACESVSEATLTHEVGEYTRTDGAEDSPAGE